MDIGKDHSGETWYWSKKGSGERNGPIAYGDLEKLAEEGKLEPEDLVWTQGMDDWEEASSIEDVEDFFKSLPPLPEESAEEGEAQEETPPSLSENKSGTQKLRYDSDSTASKIFTVGLLACIIVEIIFGGYASYITLYKGFPQENTARIVVSVMLASFLPLLWGLVISYKKIADTVEYANVRKFSYLQLLYCLIVGALSSYLLIENGEILKNMNKDELKALSFVPSYVLVGAATFFAGIRSYTENRKEVKRGALSSSSRRTKSKLVIAGAAIFIIFAAYVSSQVSRKIISEVESAKIEVVGTYTTDSRTGQKLVLRMYSSGRFVKDGISGKFTGDWFREGSKKVQVVYNGGSSDEFKITDEGDIIETNGYVLWEKRR